jgi:hypothetical protein
MITLERHNLVFRFPEVHEHATLHVDFQRTLRIPDDNRPHFLPPGLGSFPLSHIDDHAGRVPDQWLKRGGVLMPMYQAEAMWLYFRSSQGYPFAVKVAAGKVNAVSGESWAEGLNRKPQDYVVSPGQPWLDGFCVSKGMIRQFVAMPLGEGYTAEEQITGASEHGGLQIVVYPMKADAYEKLLKKRPRKSQFTALYCLSRVDEMGLAPGGLMKQEIFKDPYGLDKWETSASSRCFVHIVNSLQYKAITGANPPLKPPTAKQYTAAGLPWFDYYDKELEALEGAPALAGLDSVAAKGMKKGAAPLPENEPVSPGNVKVLTKDPRRVREGEF